MESVVLYGAGSPVIVDIEETCLRRGLLVKAIIANVDGENFAIDKSKIVGAADISPELLDLSITIPLFTPAHRKFAFDQARALGATRFNPLIDPTAILPKSLTISDGVYINSGVTLGAMSQLGDFVFINRGVSLGHHLEIDEFSSVGPGVIAGGHVKIGRGVVIGVGAVLLPGVRIGDNSVVGGGSVVIADVPENTLVVGNPARTKRDNILGYKGKSL